ncbi:CACTA transposable element [Tanacetum coccineum]
MSLHATEESSENGKMQHPVDGKAWKNIDNLYPDFGEEKRNIRLGLDDDVFNPFGNPCWAYSMWPVILTPYDMPMWLCVKTIDIVAGTKFNMRAMLLWTINYFSARSILSGWSGQGFLKKNYKWGEDRAFDGETKARDPPRKFTNVVRIEKVSIK